MKKWWFWIASILLTWIGVFPFAIVKIHNKIWSLEGFFRFRHYWEQAEAFDLLKILVAAAMSVLVAAILAGIWKRYCSGKCIKVVFFSKTLSVCIRKKQEKIIKILVLPALAVFALGAWLYVITTQEIPLETQWQEENALVAHACGGVGPYQLTNSPEALERNYQNGYRIFEADMCMTADGVLVLEHDWHTYCRKLGIEYSEDIFTYQDFMKSRFYDEFSPMDLPRMLEMLRKYPDIYIMTDFKDPYNQQNTVSAFSQILQAAQKDGCMELLDRIIVQVYSQDFKMWVDSVHVFQHYVFTCYMAPEEEKIPEVLAAYCAEENIPVITMPKEYDFAEWLPAAEKHNIQIFLHTENDTDMANEYVSAGASGIYTDYILADDLQTPNMKKA